MTEGDRKNPGAKRPRLGERTTALASWGSVVFLSERASITKPGVQRYEAS